MNLRLLYYVLWLLSSAHVIAAPAIQDSQPPIKNIQTWQSSPKLPDGWRELRRIETLIGKSKRVSVFVLASDEKNDQIVWFEKTKKHWKMSVIENIPSKKNIEYGFNIERASLSVVGNRILLGIDGTEALTYYEWSEAEGIFYRFVPG